MISWHDFQELLNSRRAVRVFSEQKIDSQIIHASLEYSLLAANTSNLQTWEFHWARSPDVKFQVISACLNQSAARTAAEIFIISTNIDKVESHNLALLEHFKNLPGAPLELLNYHQFLIPKAYSRGFLNIFGIIKTTLSFLVGLFYPVPREPYSLKQQQLRGLKSAALAAQNLMLALKTQGIDSCPMEGYDSRRLKKILKFNKNSEIAMVLAIGYPHSNFKPLPRFRFHYTKSLVEH